VRLARQQLYLKYISSWSVVPVIIYVHPLQEVGTKKNPKPKELPKARPGLYYTGV